MTSCANRLFICWTQVALVANLMQLLGSVHVWPALKSILFTKKIIKYLLYSIFFLNSSSNSSLRAWSRFILDVVFSLITNRNICFISRRTWWWWREIQLENGTSSDQSRPTSRFYQCELWVVEKIFCQKLITTLRDFNHIQGKTTETWLANVRRIFQGNNYLVLIGWDVRVRKLLPRTKI